jgi:hypothetical protein
MEKKIPQNQFFFSCMKCFCQVVKKFHPKKMLVPSIFDKIRFKKPASSKYLKKSDSKNG